MSKLSTIFMTLAVAAVHAAGKTHAPANAILKHAIDGSNCDELSIPQDEYEKFWSDLGWHMAYFDAGACSQKYNVTDRMDNPFKDYPDVTLATKGIGGAPPSPAAAAKSKQVATMKSFAIAALVAGASAGCTGASVNLAADQCAAWGEFWDGAGGPHWGGKGQNCSKSDPCACRYGVECGPKTASSDCAQSDSCDSSITAILLYSSGLVGIIPDAVGAFVDMESFNVFNSNLTGSLPASMSAWKKVKHFQVRDCHLDGALPVLNYHAMSDCVLCTAGFMRKGCARNAFSCPFPQGVTDRCEEFTGDMVYQPITNADCHNTTASE